MLKKILILSITLCTMTLFAQTEDAVNKINQLFKDGKYQDVVVQVQDYVKTYPKSENVKSLKLYMGISYLKLGNNPMAIQTFEEHNNDYPDFDKNEQVKYLIGKLYYDTAAYERSRAMLNEQLANFPGGDYSAKATELLNSIEEMEKQENPPDKKGTTSLKPASKKATYSITKITWSKIASATCLVAAPVLFVVGNNFGTKADNIYNNDYKEATTSADADKYFSQVDKYAGDSALFKNFSWISLVAAGGFFAADYFSVGRVYLEATPKKISLSYKF